MGQHRRRNLGQDHRPREEPKSGQSVRQSARAHHQRIGRRIRRIPDRSGRIRQSDARRGHGRHHSKDRARVQAQNG
jgi:hypothetical protein